MRTELVSIPTDTLPLDGAYYEPDEGATTGAVQLFHGNCMNFYVGVCRFLPPMLCALGLACLAYNRRGHDILSTRNSRAPEGGAFQTAAEAVADNRYAARWLGQRGHYAPILVGHSNGGTLAAQHAVDHPRTPALVLLSAHAGGPDIMRRISRHGLWGGDRIDEIARRSRELVSAGRPRDLLLLPGWWHVVAAESAVDLLSGGPDLLDLAPRVPCPSLYLRADQEPAELYPGESFGELCGGGCEFEVIAGCDHFYNGKEREVGTRIAAWLRQVLRL
jgi:pimeloyl-ACP methyl ester carboxylesterase